MTSAKVQWAGQRWPARRRWPVLASPGQVAPWLILVVLGLNIPSLAYQLIVFSAGYYSSHSYWHQPHTVGGRPQHNPPRPWRGHSCALISHLILCSVTVLVRPSAIREIVSIFVAVLIYFFFWQLRLVGPLPPLRLRCLLRHLQPSPHSPFRCLLCLWNSRIASSDIGKSAVAWPAQWR
jgi:hypothetical protein